MAVYTLVLQGKVQCDFQVHRRRCSYNLFPAFHVFMPGLEKKKHMSLTGCIPAMLASSRAVSVHLQALNHVP